LSFASAEVHLPEGTFSQFVTEGVFVSEAFVGVDAEVAERDFLEAVFLLDYLIVGCLDI